MIDLVDRAIGVWNAGGWAMTLLAINAFILCCVGVAVKLRMLEKPHRNIKPATYRRWIETPAERRGPIGYLIEMAMDCRSLRDLENYFEEFRKGELSSLSGDLRIMGVVVSASPLLGLLGTVTGILATFNALATGPGGEETMGMVAQGISEALITTMTGLVIALPGLMALHHLRQETEKYNGFLAHLETTCAQALYKRLKRPDGATGEG